MKSSFYNNNEDSPSKAVNRSVTFNSQVRVREYDLAVERRLRAQENAFITPSKTYEDDVMRGYDKIPRAGSINNESIRNSPSPLKLELEEQYRRAMVGAE